MKNTYREILKKALSCRTEDQLETCKDWMLRVAQQSTLSESEIKSLDDTIDVLKEWRLEQRPDVVFKWQNEDSILV